MSCKIIVQRRGRPAADHDEMLHAALAVYEPVVGWALSRERIHPYNAASAVSFPAFRDGVGPKARWCERTLEEDVAWVRGAMARGSFRP